MAKKSGKKTAPKKAAARKAALVEKAPQRGPRRIKQPQYKSLRLQKRIRHPVKLPSVWRITKLTALVFWRHKKLFIGITLVYGFLNVMLAQGLSGGTDVGELKNNLNQIFVGHLGSLASSLSVFVTLVGSAGNSTSETAGAYQVFLALIASLAIIWALRQVMAGSKLRVRDAYYRGMYPLIPFVLVICVIGLQLIPLLIGSNLYSLVIDNGIAVYSAEKLVWALLYALLSLLTFYMLSSSLFALYIVTLPNMTPMKALRSARQLVRYRRWTVLRKVLFLPILMLIIAGIIMLPIILWLTPLAQYVFFLLTMSVLVGVHSYMYTLYRELLNE